MALSTGISDNHCLIKTSCSSILVLASPYLLEEMPCTIRFHSRRPPHDSPSYVWYLPVEIASLSFCVLLSHSHLRLRSSLIATQFAAFSRVRFLA